MRAFISLLLLASTFSFGAIAPRFHGELLGGGRVSLESRLKPNRALLLCFWASWCTPCMQELKTVTQRLKENPNLPIDLLTVNVDTEETENDVKPTLRLYNFQFPVVLDPKHEIFSKYQSANTLPFSTLIKPNGEIAATFSGFHEEMFTQVKQIVGGGSSTQTKEANAKN